MNDTHSVKEMAREMATLLKDQAADSKELSQLTRELFDEITDLLKEEQPEATHLLAPNAVVEIIDQDSHVLYRRYLELAFEETGNGLRLMGDDMAGNPAGIVFLSNSALAQMKDLQGSGPDKPRCNHET
ncbi:hypothetical protein M2146_002282 [Lachnospiraceae bacterium PF1-22]|uniref:hypothetical protein n=1 Tax=Ohessyouella blattaphilus TaxID=2949333 RepID=UPI003E1F665F